MPSEFLISGNSINEQNPMPISGLPHQGTLIDRSNTITNGGTSQQVMAINGNRNYLLFQNVSDTDMWINFGTAAVANQPSLKVTAGASFFMEGFFVSTQAVQVICATTGKAFTAKEA